MELYQRVYGLFNLDILKHTDHPVATGGSPIVSWLPNQLSAVLEAMHQVHDGILKKGALKGSVKIIDAKLNFEEFGAESVQVVSVEDLVTDCGERAVIGQRVLKREVEILAKEKGKQAVDAELSRSTK